MANYLKYSDIELKAILCKYDSLTFLAKIELKKELLNRNLSLDTADFKELDLLIAKEMKNVKQLKFMSDIGFDVNWFNDNQSFEITRSSKATIIDTLAIFFGLIFSVIATFGLSFVIGYLFFDVPFTTMGIIFNSFLLLLGFYGFRILSNGFNRLIKYKDFKFIVNQKRIILRKRFDFKIQEIEDEISSLNLKIDDQIISLMSGDVEIINASSPSFGAKLTLKEIASYSIF